MTPTDDLQKEIEAKAAEYCSLKNARWSNLEWCLRDAFETGYRAALESRPEVTALALENAELRVALASIDRDRQVHHYSQSGPVARQALARPPTHYARLGAAYRELRDAAGHLAHPKSGSGEWYQIVDRLRAALARVEAAERGGE